MLTANQSVGILSHGNGGSGVEFIRCSELAPLLLAIPIHHTPSIWLITYLKRRLLWRSRFISSFGLLIWRAQLITYPHEAIPVDHTS